MSASGFGKSPGRDERLGSDVAVLEKPSTVAMGVVMVRIRRPGAGHG